MSSTGLARDHRDPLAARTLPRHGNGARRARSLARGGGALNRSAFGGGPRVSQETRGKLRSWGGRAAGRGGASGGAGVFGPRKPRPGEKRGAETEQLEARRAERGYPALWDRGPLRRGNCLPTMARA